MDEYERIQRIWEARSRHIMTWGQVFIPLGAGIVALFISQLGTFVDRGWGFGFLLSGWFLLFLCMGYWRWVVHYIDRQIVGMYPRMLELERIRGMETQTLYYFNNLHRRGRQELANVLGMEYKEVEDLTYRRFREKVSEQQGNVQDILFTVWDRLDHRSVTSRGHVPQDWVVGIILLMLLGVIILGCNFRCF